MACIFEVEFNRVAPGGNFCIENPNYEHNKWPYCGPMLRECLRLETPTPNGFNAVDENGKLLKMADTDKVVMSYGRDR